MIGSFLLTEPGAGSDAASITTHARRHGGGWRIDGEKAWVTNGAGANLLKVSRRPIRPKVGAALPPFWWRRTRRAWNVFLPTPSWAAMRPVYAAYDSPKWMSGRSHAPCAGQSLQGCVVGN